MGRQLRIAGTGSTRRFANITRKVRGGGPTGRAAWPIVAMHGLHTFLLHVLSTTLSVKTGTNRKITLTQVEVIHDSYTTVVITLNV